jgi:hypothetical protein
MQSDTVITRVQYMILTVVAQLENSFHEAGAHVMESVVSFTVFVS